MTDRPDRPDLMDAWRLPAGVLRTLVLLSTIEAPGGDMVAPGDIDVIAITRDPASVQALGGPAPRTLFAHLADLRARGWTYREDGRELLRRVALVWPGETEQKRERAREKTRDLIATAEAIRRQREELLLRVIRESLGPYGSVETFDVLQSPRLEGWDVDLLEETAHRLWASGRLQITGSNPTILPPERRAASIRLTPSSAHHQRGVLLIPRE